MTVLTKYAPDYYTIADPVTDHTITFPFVDADDIKATVTHPTTDVDTELTAGVDFTATLSPSQIVLSGAAATLYDGYQLTIWMDMPFLQDTDYKNAGSLDLEVVEDDYDVAALERQQLLEEIGRCVKGPITDPVPVSSADYLTACKNYAEDAEAAAERAEAVEAIYKVVEDLAVDVITYNVSGEDVTFVLGDEQAVAADLTANDNIKFDIRGEGLISVAATKHFTVQSPAHIIASKKQTIVNMTAGNTTDPIFFEVGGDVHAGWFGATGDGTTDDGPAIQAAINSLEENNCRGDVELASGAFITGQRLDISKSYIGMMGMGRASTFLKRKADTDVESLLRINQGFGGQLNNNRVKDMTFHGNGTDSAQTGFYGFGLNVVNSDFCELHNLQFLACRSTAMLLAKSGSNGMTGISVENIVVSDTGNSNEAPLSTIEPDSIAVSGVTNSNFSDLHVQEGFNNGNGFILYNGATGNRVSNLFVANIEGSGIALDGITADGAVTRNQIVNFRLDNCDSNGIWLLSGPENLGAEPPEYAADLSYNQFTNGIISNCDGTGYGDGDGIAIYSENGKNTALGIQFTNIELANNAGYGIRNYNGQDCTFNQCFMNGNTTGDYYDVSDTYFIENTYEFTPYEVLNAGSGLDVRVWGVTKLVTTAGAITATLGDGDFVGQRKHILMIIYGAGNSATITVTSHDDASADVGVFSAANQFWILEWTGAMWTNISASCALS